MRLQPLLKLVHALSGPGAAAAPAATPALRLGPGRRRRSASLTSHTRERRRPGAAAGDRTAGGRGARWRSKVPGARAAQRRPGPRACARRHVDGGRGGSGRDGARDNNRRGPTAKGGAIRARHPGAHSPPLLTGGGAGEGAATSLLLRDRPAHGRRRRGRGGDGEPEAKEGSEVKQRDGRVTAEYLPAQVPGNIGRAGQGPREEEPKRCPKPHRGRRRGV